MKILQPLMEASVDIQAAMICVSACVCICSGQTTVMHAHTGAYYPVNDSTVIGEDMHRQEWHLVDAMIWENHV